MNGRNLILICFQWICTTNRYCFQIRIKNMLHQNWNIEIMQHKSSNFEIILFRYYFWVNQRIKWNELQVFYLLFGKLYVNLLFFLFQSTTAYIFEAYGLLDISVIGSNRICEQKENWMKKWKINELFFYWYKQKWKWINTHIHTVWTRLHNRCTKFLKLLMNKQAEILK